MILKFPLTDPLPYNHATTSIPVHKQDTKFLLVAYQRGQLCVWVNSRGLTGEIELHIYGTGTLPEPGLVHIGSCQNPNDGCVWHVYREE